MGKKPIRRGIVTAALTVVTLIALVEIFYIGFIRNSLGQSLDDNMLELTVAKAQLLDSEIENYFNALESVGAAISGSDEEKRDWVLSRFRYQTDRSLFERICLIGEDGSGYGYDQNIGVLGEADFSALEYFQKAQGGENYVSGPFLDTWTYKVMVAFAIPYRGDHGNGVLCGLLRSENLAGVLDSDIYSGRGYCNVMDAEGNLLFVSSLATGRYDGPENVFSAEYAYSRGMEQMREDLRRGNSGHVVFRFLDSPEKYACYAPLEVNHWYVTAVVPNAYVRHSGNVIFGAAAAMSVFMTLVVVLLLSSLTRARHQRERDAMEAAFRDPLTGGGNRAKLVAELHRESGFFTGGWALAVYNCCNFSFFNSVFGYERGDELLRNLYGRLSEILENGELCVRLNSDKFALLLHCGKREAVTNRLRPFLEQFHLSEQHRNFEIISQFGVCFLTPKDAGADQNTLLDRAAQTLRGIQERHRGSIAFYDESVMERIAFAHSLELSMRGALEKGEFQLYIQPKYAVGGQRPEPAGGEALARWQSEQFGFLTPDRFIPVFEAGGFVTELDRYMLEALCRRQREWLDAEIPCVTVSINMSRRNLYDPHFVARLTEIVDHWRVPHELIQVEITESSFFQDREVLAETLDRLRELGFGTAMDDFGSGWSSLNLLKDFSFDAVKVDKGFFDDTLDSSRGREIVAKVIDMLKGLGFTVVAEGIEEKEQVEFLKDCGCDLIQGYYFGRPVPAEEFQREHLTRLAKRREEDAYAENPAEQ